MGHTRLTTYMVAPTMMIELGTGLWLLWQRPVDILPVQVRLGIGLLGIIWLSTVFVQVPHHERLTQGFDPIIHRKLITSNWLRTRVWSARGLLNDFGHSTAWMNTRETSNAGSALSINQQA